MDRNLYSPDYLFEVSWEVCNKVGGLYTVISTKAQKFREDLDDRYILIGPDVWRDDEENPDFIEDPDLFRVWREKAAQEGLVISVGRWKIPGNPITIIVDFKTFINSKDEIFSKFWELYKLDSLSGQWDYIEPALFGYATGKVIESFVKFNLSTRENVLAHFHEWMTGNGILYLKNNIPQVGTAFTAHSTVIGRGLSFKNRQFYKDIEGINPEQVAREINSVAKYSLEKLSAQHADTFTTISQITAKECSQFLKRDVDIITPNGYNDHLVPRGEDYVQRRENSRKKQIEVLEALLGYQVDPNALLIATSGNYEFENKGIDLYIKSLAEINRLNQINKDIYAFIWIPANHYDPNPQLVDNLLNKKKEPIQNNCITHHLHDEINDPILKHLKSQRFTNSKEDKVKVVFIPCYLNGRDGIFNLPYYDMLIGMDLTVFPSYYEPWGYTPMESMAYHVPSLTSTLSGFGSWLMHEHQENRKGIKIIDPVGKNSDEIVKSIAEYITEMSKWSPEQHEEARENAIAISKIVSWDNLIAFYNKAYDHALKEIEKRRDLFLEKEQTPIEYRIIKKPPINEARWKELNVKSNLTEKLTRLEELSKNVWWSWNTEATELFEEIDPKLWQETENNPIALLENVDLKRFYSLENNPAYIEKLNRVMQEFDQYLQKKPATGTPKIAYFSMEFGVHSSIKIYSGGLGILAGDYLKEASDSCIDLVAVGLLYKYGYFKQILSVHGEQQAQYEPQILSHLPLEKVVDQEGKQLTIQIVLPGRTLTARIWKIMIGRIPLFLLDTDYEANTSQDRFITHHLYGGDNENRLKQELLLGIGGIRALEAMGIKADVYHSNEGHSAFIGLERLRRYIKDHNLSFDVAKEIVRASTLFTTHTPVPAGHDYFNEELLRIYIAHYPERLKITWDDLMSLGRLNPFDKNEKFSMSILAANLSQEMNGVSKLHGKVSQEMFSNLWRGYLPEENHISYVTNGVHYPTWTAKEMRALYEKVFRDNFVENQDDKQAWSKIQQFSDEELWDIKQSLKEKLYAHIRERFMSNWLQRYEQPKDLVDIIENINKDALTIGFARRFATYKRAALLFNNPQRLAEIVNDEEKPVQFIFAGKAHPQDGGGQELIKKIVALSRQPEFRGKILFLQNYDMALAKYLVSGVDIWLNTPTRPLEASGTSGEKAAMNGTIHFSVLDGWWYEGYKPNAGWALTEKRTYDNQDFQNELDAETIYHILEDEIIPLYYDRDKNGIPGNWVKVIKNTISEVAPQFTMKRMLDDYIRQYYHKMAERKHQLIIDDFKESKDIALWKKMITRQWENIEVISVSLQENLKTQVKIGEKYFSEVVLDLKGLMPEEVGLEFIIVKKDEKSIKLIQKQEYKYIKDIDNHSLYRISLTPDIPGLLHYSIRMFPKHKSLPHRQDLSLVKWIGD